MEQNNKVTISDVAREAGVSRTTVSFVINNKQDQSIKDETKNKVWQIVNLLGYKPNVFAKNLRLASTSKIIAFWCKIDSFELKRFVIIDFLSQLQNTFEDFDFNLLLVGENPEKITSADAILAYDVGKEEFLSFGEKNFIPLVAVDSVINHPLFFQITTDYQKLNAEAKVHFQKPFTFVCVTPSDNGVKKEIIDTFENVSFIDTFSQIENIKNENILLINKFIYENLKAKKFPNIFYCDKFIKMKMEQIANCLKNSMSHDKFDVHSYKI